MSIKNRLSTSEAFRSRDVRLSALDDSQLNDLQTCVLSIADDVISLCEEYGLTYNLGGGSALGAVRHKGFIPWDEDIDIDMPRKEFDRFKELFLDRYADQYWLQYPGQPNDCSVLFAKVRKKGTVLRGPVDTSSEYGIGIDIFLINNTYDNPIARLFHGVISQFFGLIISCSRFHQYKDEYLWLAQGNESLSRVVKLKSFIGTFVSWRPAALWAVKADKWNSRCKNDTSKYVTVPAGRHHFFGEMRPREMYEPRTRLEFEGRFWCVPGEYHEYLSEYYGDYMTIPSENERETHLFIEVDLGDSNGLSESSALDDSGRLR